MNTVTSRPAFDDKKNARMVLGDTVESGAAISETPVVPIGLPTLVKMAFDGKDWTSIWNALVDRLDSNPDDAAALLDLSTLAHIRGRPDDRPALYLRTN